MKRENSVNVEAVTRFVRQELGCNCSEEVFRHISVRAGSSAVQSWPADYELQIGGRLLIVLGSESGSELSPAQLQQVVAEGKQARDAGKFNRFRFVLQSRDAARERERLQSAFEALPNKDEKTYLHVLQTGSVPQFLRP